MINSEIEQQLVAPDINISLPFVFVTFVAD